MHPSPLERSVDFALAPKATNTIVRRLGAFTAFVDYAVSNGQSPFPMSSRVRGASVALQQKAPPPRRATDAPLTREDSWMSSGMIAWSTALIQLRHWRKLLALLGAAMLVCMWSRYLKTLFSDMGKGDWPSDTE